MRAGRADQGVAGIDDAVAVGVLVQVDGDVGDARVRAVEGPVVALVIEDRVADGAGAAGLIAEVSVQALFAGRQRHLRCAVGRAFGSWCRV